MPTGLHGKQPWEKLNDEGRHPYFTVMQWIRNSKMIEEDSLQDTWSSSPLQTPFRKFLHTMEDTSGPEKNSVDLERTRASSWVVKGDQSVKVITWYHVSILCFLQLNLSRIYHHLNLIRIYIFVERRFTVLSLWIGHVDVSHLANQAPALLALPWRGCKLNSVLSVTKSGAFSWTNGKNM